MPGLRLTAIKPTRSVVPVQGLTTRVDRELRDFGGDVIREMSKYPPQQPWKGNREPKTGPRRGGRRTSIYGKNWRYGNVRAGLVEVINMTPYAVHVGGPKTGAKNKRQAKAMAARGWPNVTDVANRIWERRRPAIQRAITVTR